MKKLSLLILCFGIGAGLSALSLKAQDTSAVAGTPEIDHMVYLSFIPEPSDLMADARKNGLTILRLDKLADRVVVTYQYPDGHTATLGYARFDSAPATERVAARPVQRMETVDYVPATTTVVRDPEVVYVDRSYPSTRVVYRDYNDSFWPPLFVGLGLGYVSGHYSNHHSYYSPRYSYRGSYSNWHGGYRGGGSYRGGHSGGSHGGGRRH